MNKIKTQWRQLPGFKQFIVDGGDYMCPAVLGTVGQDELGWWWHARTEPEKRGRAENELHAKIEVEAATVKYWAPQGGAS